MNELNHSANANPMASRPDYDTEIVQLIAQKLSPKVMRDRLEEFHANDIADAFTRLDDVSREKLFKLLDAQRLAEVISYLDEDQQADYLNNINIKKAIAILSEMEPQDAGRILKNMSRTRRDVIIELLDSDLRKKIARIYAYGEEEIGSVMSTDFIEIRKNSSIKEAMRSLRDQTRQSNTDNISVLYVVDENGLYYGAIHIQDLFASSADENLEEIIELNFPIVYASETIDSIMDDLKDYAEDSIPVLSNDNQIEGIITKQDLLEVFDKEMSEDYARLAGLAAEEDLQESLFASLKKRTPWLLLLLVLSLGVSAVISLFESVVASVTIAVAFQSLILDMSGNVGTQSLAVSIRVLSDPDLKTKEKLYLIVKETRTGFVNGCIIGSGSALVLGLFIHFSSGYSWIQAYSIALCIALAMMVSMVISSFTGTAIPVVFQKFGIDPAAASGPLITTLNDLIGATTYYSMIWIILIQIMHI